MTKDMKTALVLGGGGARGAYEIGVWQALRETDTKIDIITGTSVGAINGALVAQDAFDLSVAMWKQLQTDLILCDEHKNGTGPLKSLLKQYIDETAIRNSKADFGLATLELPSFTLRYFFKEDIPNGKLIDYLLASSALFPAFKIQNIDKIKYVDGGYFDNLPVEMALTKGATHVVAVDLETAGIVRKEPLKKVENLLLIRCKWDLGNILEFDCDNTERIMRLGYLDTLKAFNFYDGSFYCFSKGEITKRAIAAAETAAKIFELNPAILYSKQIFNRCLENAIDDYRTETEQELSDFNRKIRDRRLGLDSLQKLLHKINQRTLTIIIADLYKTNSILHNQLTGKPILTLFKDEVKAAEYLLREGLI